MVQAHLTVLAFESPGDISPLALSLTTPFEHLLDGRLSSNDLEIES